MMLFLFFIVLLYVLLPNLTTLFISKHGWLHRSLGALMLSWLIYGTIHVTCYSSKAENLRIWAISCFVIDVLLSVLGLITTLSAARDFPHKLISNSPGQSGTLAEEAIVTQSEMIEHSFYQLLNLFQALFLHYMSWIGPVFGHSLSISNRIIALTLVTSPWLVRKRFPVHSFSSNWKNNQSTIVKEKSLKNSKSTRVIEQSLYRVKKWQYIFYKHFIFHGLNIAVSIFPLVTIDLSLSKFQPSDLLIPLSSDWRIFWLSLNSSYVLEFFLQTLVKRSVITQRSMLRFQIMLMSISTISAIKSGALFGAIFLGQRSASTKTSIMLRLIIGTISMSLNFLNRGHDLLNTLLIAISSQIFIS